MAAIQHIFVLMLENRSFDHMFGFSKLSGLDGATGGPTVVEGLTGNETNTFGGRSYQVQCGADFAMPFDPGHEFPNVLDQLCGSGVRYAAPYPSINHSGFVESYVQSGGGATPGEVMKCFDTARQLPVLHTLAQEFAICDHWFASMPGPTWPNRMFVHAASSGGLDYSPSTSDILLWETLDGFSFPRGDIFSALKKAGQSYHLYSGDEFPMVSALKGIAVGDVDRIEALVRDLGSNKPFPYSYVFIEPSYNVLHDYRNSSSMHPLGDVRDGEALVKTVYEALRASNVWDTSMLVVLWDEHGGFYDHVTPPAAVPPGDTAPSTKYNHFGFTFAQYGVRVPALVISPLVPKGVIDHRLHDHSSVPRTLEVLFAMKPLTARDAAATDLFSLFTLGTPRTDAPMKLPSPASVPSLMAAAAPHPSALLSSAPVPVTRENDSVNDGILPLILHSAMRQDILLNPTQKNDILRRIAALHTRGDAMTYLAEVQQKIRSRAR